MTKWSTTMTKSILAATLALGLSAGIAGAARADQSNLVSQTTTAQTTQGASINAYNANVNPDATVPTTGVYDESDRFVGPNGFPLPGDPTIAAQD
jgi:hypothetical protein